MNLGYIMYRAPQRPASTYAFGLDGKRTKVSYARRIVLFLLQKDEDVFSTNVVGDPGGLHGDFLRPQPAERRQARW